MSTTSIEERVAILENQMAFLLNRPDSGDQRPGWQRAIDQCTGDETMRAIDQAALAYREEDRRRFKEEYDSAESRVE
jgi:hypothetical protein